MLTSVQKALRVIDHLAENGPSGVSNLGRSLEVTIGTAHRLVTTLVGAGYVVQHPDKRYGLSPKIVELARKIRPSAGLVEIARPHLERLMALTGETVNLGTLIEDEVLYVDHVVTEQMLAFNVRIGSRAPVFATALGRVLLAYATPDVQDSYLRRLKSIARTASRPAPTVEELRRLLASVRTNGHAEEDGGLVAEVACVAAPVLNLRGQVVAAVSISGPRSRICVRRNDLAVMVRDGAGAIGEAIAVLGEQVDL